MVAYPINSAPSTETVYLSFFSFVCWYWPHMRGARPRYFGARTIVYDLFCFAFANPPHTCLQWTSFFYLPNASSPPELRVKTSLIITSLEYCLRAKLWGADVGMSNYQPIRLCFERDLGRSLFSFLFGTNETQQIRARSRSNRSAVDTRWCAWTFLFSNRIERNIRTDNVNVWRWSKKGGPIYFYAPTHHLGFLRPAYGLLLWRVHIYKWGLHSSHASTSAASLAGGDGKLLPPRSEMMTKTTAAAPAVPIGVSAMQASPAFPHQIFAPSPHFRKRCEKSCFRAFYPREKV